MLNQVGRIEWFQSENGIFDVFWCLEMLLEKCCDSLYSRVWWLTDEMAEKDEKLKKNRSACYHSHRWAQQANTAPKIGKKFPIISLELQTIVLNLYNWKRLISFQICIAVILCVYVSFEGISICRVFCVFIANFGVEYVECIIKLAKIYSNQILNRFSVGLTMTLANQCIFFSWHKFRRLHQNVFQEVWAVKSCALCSLSCLALMNMKWL